MAIALLSAGLSACTSHSPSAAQNNFPAHEGDGGSGGSNGGGNGGGGIEGPTEKAPGPVDPDPSPNMKV